MALIVTSGGLGPTADDLTAEIVGRFAGRELVLDEAMEEKIAAILRKPGQDRRCSTLEAMREANRKQALVPEGAIPIDLAGTAPGLVVPADGTVVAPARRASFTRSGHERSRPSRCAQCSLARTPMRPRPFACLGSRSRGVMKTLREIEEEIDLSPLEITTCLRQAELVVDIRQRLEDEALSSNRVIDAIADRHGRFVFSRRGVDRRSGGRAS